jgi:hypothetical protein
MKHNLGFSHLQMGGPMKKRTVIALLILILMIGVSSATAGKQKPTRSSSNRPIPIAALMAQSGFQSSISVKKRDPEDPSKVIMILETRNYMLTIYGGAGHLYAVSTQDGVALADKLDLNDLKIRFPELHELLSESWACDSPMQFDGKL